MRWLGAGVDHAVAVQVFIETLQVTSIFFRTRLISILLPQLKYHVACYSRKHQRVTEQHCIHHQEFQLVLPLLCLVPFVMCVFGSDRHCMLKYNIIDYLRREDSQRGRYGKYSLFTPQSDVTWQFTQSLNTNFWIHLFCLPLPRDRIM